MNSKFSCTFSHTELTKAKKFKLVILISAVVLIGSCTQKKVNIPQEGDVVTWKHKPELLIKTKLGQRREHIVNIYCDRCEANYEPQYDRFIGQFPIDYKPDSFPKLTEEEYVTFLAEYGKVLHARNSSHDIEFNLMLNGAMAKATDKEPINTSKALDDVNQVKVRLNTMSTSTLDETYFTKQGNEYYKKSYKYKQAKKAHEFGLECAFETSSITVKRCFGTSENKRISGVSISAIGDGDWFNGHSTEPVYGGIKVQWRTHRQNLKHWKEIDAAIWRLLEAWNVSPHPETTIYIDKNKEGDVVTWQLTPELVVKTALGQRQIKRYESFESSRFLGQFPIDYLPQKENLHDNNMPVEERPGLTLTFNLLLNKQKNLRITGFYSRTEVDQVKVQVRQGSEIANSRHPRDRIKYLYRLDVDSLQTDPLGLKCPRGNGDPTCIAKSSNSKNAEFLLHIDKGVINHPSTGEIRGDIYTKRYGSLINVNWRANIANLKDWKEIDSAIWRLLDTWNVANKESD